VTNIDLVPNLFSGVIQVPVTTLTCAPAGVVVAAIASGGFGWLQTRGACGVLTDATPVIGEALVVSSAAAGAAGPFTDTEANSNGEAIIGYSMTVAADTQWSTVNLNLDG